MGVLAYLPYGVHNSPYKRLFDPILWTEICEVFVKDACSLLGFSVESPLSVWYVDHLLFKEICFDFKLLSLSFSIQCECGICIFASTTQYQTSNGSKASWRDVECQR